MAGVFIDAAAATGPVTPAAAQAPNSRDHGNALERRVELYARQLHLDAGQQAQLRALLAWQREQVRQVWRDPGIDAANRINATRAIGVAAADRMRALLTPEQRKQFNPPRPQRPAHDPTAPSVQDWLDAASHQQAG
ncbi:MAG: hypothetical protein KGJ52_05110 [Gammaproteobacteria bacterium]|nr:hypothetical protein [Gammaproteobacteria bacterium]